MHRRSREVYEDNNYRLFKEISAEKFIKNTKPIEDLGSSNKISYLTEESRHLKLLPETTKRIISCCEDLKVLGK